MQSYGTQIFPHAHLLEHELRQYDRGIRVVWLHLQQVRAQGLALGDVTRGQGQPGQGQGAAGVGSYQAHGLPVQLHGLPGSDSSGCTAPGRVTIWVPAYNDGKWALDLDVAGFSDVALSVVACLHSM